MTTAKSTPPRSLMIIEDDLGVRTQIRWGLDEYEVHMAEDRHSAMQLLQKQQPAVVLLDLGLPPDPDGTTEGLMTLEQIRMDSPATKVIVLTGSQDHGSAVKAIALGAIDFCQKPFDIEILKIIIERALRVYDLEQENRNLQATHHLEPIPGLITNDPDMLKLCRMIEKIAPSNVSAMLIGESGTGKEILARGLHNLSSRSNNRFVAINCAAIPENLLESELFGYEKGAFTGADKQTPGKLEYAHNGTLFLDEIGDLPLPLQAKLLRFLQERVVERLGGRREIPVDVRVITATHRDLPELIQTGRFREDLYYRLSEFVIQIPPLRQRRGDQALLAHALLTRFNQENRHNLRGFSQDALQAMEAHPWPGNVREMVNIIKRAAILAEGTHITCQDLGLAQNDEIPAKTLNLREIRNESERLAVTRAIAQSNGNIAKSAELLGVSRPTLYDLLKRHGIEWLPKGDNTV